MQSSPMMMTVGYGGQCQNMLVTSDPWMEISSYCSMYHKRQISLHVNCTIFSWIWHIGIWFGNRTVGCYHRIIPYHIDGSYRYYYVKCVILYSLHQLILIPYRPYSV